MSAAMKKIIIGTNTARTIVIVPEDTIIKTLLEENNIDYLKTTVHLDGAPLLAGDINKPLSAFNIQESAYLLAVVKAENN